jgi:hypothetical protein
MFCSALPEAVLTWDTVDGRDQEARPYHHEQIRFKFAPVPAPPVEIYKPALTHEPESSCTISLTFESVHPPCDRPPPQRT